MGHWVGKRFALVAFESVLAMASNSRSETFLRRRILEFNCEPTDCRFVFLIIIPRKVMNLLGRELVYPNPAAHRNLHSLIAL